jgi:hypothetical protein
MCTSHSGVRVYTKLAFQKKILRESYDDGNTGMQSGEHAACEERARKLRTIAEQAVSAAGGRDTALQKERDRTARLAKRCAMLQARLAEAGIHDHGDTDVEEDHASVKESDAKRGGDARAVPRDTEKARDEHATDGTTSDKNRSHDVDSAHVLAHEERGRSHDVYSSSESRRRRSSSRSSSSSSRRSSSRESRHEEVVTQPEIDANQEFFI